MGVNFKLLKEDDGFLLLQNGDKILLEGLEETLAAQAASYVLTGATIGFNRLYGLACSAASYIFTGKGYGRFLITPSSINGDLYYDLSLAPPDFWNQVRSDGGDIRVTAEDGTTMLPREVSGFDYDNHLGSVFIGGLTGYTACYIYYGNPSATEPAADSAYGKYNVWESDAKLAAHLEDMNDATSNQNNGSSAIPPSFMAGKIKNSGSFNGSSNYIEMVSKTVWDWAAGDFTISIWVKNTSNKESYSQGPVQIGKMVKDSSVQYWSLGTNGSGNIKFYYWNGSKQSITGTTVVPLNTWTLLTMTFSGTAIKLYINNNLDVSGTKTGTIPTDGSTPLTFGANQNTFQNGYSDEARIYSRALSASEIATMYANQSDPAAFWTTGPAENNIQCLFKYPATPAEFEWTGAWVMFPLFYSLACSAASYLWTGGVAMITRAWGVVCDIAEYTLTGSEIVIGATWKIATAIAEYTLTGSSVMITRIKGLVVQAGSFVWTGASIMTQYGITIVADIAEFTLTYLAATIIRGAVIITTPASYIFTGRWIPSFLNGVSLLWRKAAAVASSWTKQASPTSTWTKQDSPTSTWTKRDDPPQ